MESAFATYSNHDRLGGGAGLAADGLAGLHDLHALGDRAEDDVLAVKPVGLDGAQEELRAVGAGASIGHGQDARACRARAERQVSRIAAAATLT